MVVDWNKSNLQLERCQIEHINHLFATAVTLLRRLAQEDWLFMLHFGCALIPTLLAVRYLHLSTHDLQWKATRRTSASKDYQSSKLAEGQTARTSTASMSPQSVLSLSAQHQLQSGKGEALCGERRRVTATRENTRECWLYDTADPRNHTRGVPRSAFFMTIPTHPRRGLDGPPGIAYSLCESAVPRFASVKRAEIVAGLGE